jgi:phospholipase C
MGDESGISRRTVLKGIGAAIGATAVGCGSSKSGGGGADASSGSPDAGLPDGPPPDAAPPDALVRTCTGNGGFGPAELLAPIENIVVLMMENRSFDHYFGSLQLLEGRADLLGLDGTESNLDDDGNPVTVHLLEDFTPADPPHGWGACHNQWNGGANDGFVTEHSGSNETDVMGYHVRSQLPQLYALVDGGVICDRWYSAVLGPTWPNRYYLHGANSGGRKSNIPYPGFKSIFDVLDDAGISHKNYYHDVAWASGAYLKTSGLATIESYFEDAAAGTLPQYSLIDPQFFGSGANDDHPSHDIRMGQALIAAVFNALAQSPQWSNSLFVITYDEHGGFYDHIAPPTTTDDDAEFAQLGFRVPSVVAGPFVRQGCAVNTMFEHTSVLSTLTRRFDLEPLNDRVSATNDLSPCIDPTRFDDPLEPPTLPPVEVSMSALRGRRVDPTVHSEIASAIDAAGIPARLDRRDQAMAITERVLAHGERLGAVVLSD